MRSVRALFILALAMSAPMLPATTLRAQEADTSTVTAPPPPGVSASLDSARAIRGASLVVSLYTYGHTDNFAERFGHAALGIRDTVNGTDVVFNWGIFDWDSPNFLVRFLTGDTRYWMVGYSTSQFNELYQSQNRSIRQQVLALNAVERAALFEYVRWNAQDEHKYYRYDYYRDNCTTRIRNLLNRTLGGRLKAAHSTEPGTRTWRDETARTLAYSLPLYAGIQLALGRHADEPLRPWDEEFLPEHMATHFASAVLTSAEGARYRFVQSDTVLYTSTRAPLPAEPPSWLAMAVLLGLTLAGLLAGLADAKPRAARVVFAIVVSLWYLVGGLLGTALLLAGTVTKHIPYMGANTSLFALQPLLLFAAIIVPIALLRGVRSRAAVGTSMLIVLLSLVGLLLQLLPGWRQHSGVVLAVVIPVHIAIAIAVWRLEGRQGARGRP